MKFKKKINNNLLKLEYNIWTSKFTVEYDDETIYESWDIAIYLTIWMILMFILGVLFGSAL